MVTAVYDRRLQRVVARKALKPGARVGGFLREAQLAASLQHPGIVPIYDAQEDGQGPWYTMRRVEGRSLADALDEASTLSDRLRLLPAFERVCEAMAYAHEQGVVHRDLKPANVMLGSFGEVMVVDFGLAVRTAQDKGGRIVGTPSFMSPEAARGERVSTASDVWSLGATLYTLLTGRPPYQGGGRALIEQLGRKPPAPPAPPAEVPRELVAIVEKAMRVDPGQRYPSAVQLCADVSAYTAGQLVGAHAYTPWELLRHFAWRYRANLVALALVTATLLIVIAGAWWQTRVERDRALRAESERTAQLALALEARSRSLGGAPGAVDAARQALALDPTLPWARGVLAEFSSPLEVEEVQQLPLEGCTVVHQVGDRAVVGCGQRVLLLEYDGTVIDELDWDMRASKPELVRVSDGQVYAVNVEGDTLGYSDQPMPASLDEGGLSLLLLRRDVETLSWACVMVEADRTRWTGPCEGELTHVPAKLLGGLGDYRAASRPGGPSLVWTHAGVQVCDEQVQRCRTLAFPGVVQLALWDRNAPRAVILAASGEVMLYDEPSDTIWPLERASAGGVQQLVWVDGLVVALNVRNEVFVYDTDGSEVGRFALEGTGPTRLGTVGRDLWILREDGVRIVRLHPPEVPPMVRTNNGIGALEVQGDKLWASIDDTLVTIDGADVRPVVRVDDFVKDIALYDGGVLIGTGRTGVFHWRDGALESVAPNGVRRVEAGADGWIAGSFRGELLGTGLTSRGDLDTAAGLVIHESEPRTVQVTELATGRVLFQETFAQDVWALAVSPDGRHAAFALADHRVRSVDLVTGLVTLLPGLHRAYVAALAYSPSGHRLASGSWDGTSYLWRDGEIEAALEAHLGRVTQLGFANEDLLVTGSWDATVRRWNLAAW